ncbi:MAG: hypothetical protein ABI435_08045 [Pseudolysinimonas sp.]
MTRSRGLATGAPAAGVVLLATLLLGGCAAGGTGTVGDLGTPSSSAPSDPTDGSTGSSGTDLGNDAGHTEIPATYPRDDVPLIDDDAVFAVDLGTGWSIILPTDDRAGDLAQIDGLLTGKGFAQDFTSTTADGTFTQYSNETYTVQITGSDTTDFGEVVQYVVVLK